ncbi:hypothetical protein EI555_020477, partial [Monodon monoceros]
MKRGGGAQGPGCCPSLARPLAELCAPPEPGRQVRGAGHADRGVAGVLVGHPFDTV